MTKGLETEGRAGDRGLRGKDGTYQGAQRAPERPHGGAASRVWTLSPFLSDGLLSGCLVCSDRELQGWFGFRSNNYTDAEHLLGGSQAPREIPALQVGVPDKLQDAQLRLNFR